jgi:ribose transport system permease protein
VIQNVINQGGTLNTDYLSVVSGAFLAVVVAVQACPSRASR